MPKHLNLFDWHTISFLRFCTSWLGPSRQSHHFQERSWDRTSDLRVQKPIIFVHTKNNAQIYGTSFFFLEQCGRMEGVLTLPVRDRCLIEVVGLGSGIFPRNFHTKWFLWNVHVRFACAGSRKMPCPEFVSSMFLVNYGTKWLSWHVHVRFDCAGSHKTGLPESGSRAFFLWFSIQNDSAWWNVHVCFGCAGSHKPCPQHWGLAFFL